MGNILRLSEANIKKTDIYVTIIILKNNNFFK